jgi:indolepyruvate ferredoxin oxidoreductase beta subunit
MPSDSVPAPPARNRLSIAIVALGGQGGGVLADWLVDVAESYGWLVQSTSAPGVAQRTGSTVYYLEAAAPPAAGGAEPVLALMPVPGDVDVVVAPELMEAGRAVARGLVTPDRTTLIASSHRVYGITEKSAAVDGIADPRPVLAALRSEARRLVLFDMERACAETGSVVSSVLCGAIAAADALPFPRALYEDAIRRSGVAVEANLAGFAAGWQRARVPEAAAADGDAAAAPVAAGPTTEIGRRLDARVRAEFPEALHPAIRDGVRRMVEYQDARYAGEYLDRLGATLRSDQAAGGAARGFALTRAFAQRLAIWMAYEDAIRVAELKTRPERFDRVRADSDAGSTQVLQVTDYLHPRFEDFCEMLPAPIGERLARSPFAARGMGPLFRSGRRIETSRLRGFLLLRLIARLRRWRRASWRHRREMQGIDAWSERIRRIAAMPDAAFELVECQSVVAGYGDTRERGLRRFESILQLVDRDGSAPDLAARVRRLRTAADPDES